MLKLKGIEADEAEALLPWIEEFNQADRIETPIARIQPALERLLREPSLGRAWWIKNNGKPAGYLILTFGYDLEYGGRDAWITDFYVRHDFQGQGIGAAALHELESICKKLEVCALHLMVRDSNTVAKRVYSKRGFEPHSRSAWMKLIKET